MRFASALAGAPRRCLIVDDEASMRSIVRRLLQAEGFECLEASCGAEAL